MGNHCFNIHPAFFNQVNCWQKVGQQAEGAKYLQLSAIDIEGIQVDLSPLGTNTKVEESTSILDILR